MGKRQQWISSSIIRAVFYDIQADNRSTVLLRILSFFSIFKLLLARFEAALFKKLRSEVWQLDEDEYHTSFSSAKSREGLKAVGDLGYSGSSFFETANSKLLIKSLPRSFEYTFFQTDLIKPYSDHMVAHPNSLLVRITDFLWTPYPSLGSILGITPSHHIIMENILYGKGSSSKASEWETYDLKPTSYFFPERDIAGGMLASEATKSRLADYFPDKVRITGTQADELMDLLKTDTNLLEQANAVDYSLFVVRYPADDEPEHLLSKTNEWRTGLMSRDKKWKYRVVLLDFFWAKHKFQAQAMTGLVDTFNVFGRKGPMSITTTPEEYRERFLKMVTDMIEVSQV